MNTQNSVIKSLITPAYTQFPQRNFNRRLSPFGQPSSVLYLRYWCLVLASGILALFFGMRGLRRFNLRSLFVVTTALAIALTLVMWMDRTWIGK
jgi:hypothetical protein